MYQSTKEIYIAVVITTLIFLMVAMGPIFLVTIYNKRKKKHIEEKQLMQLTFEAELVKTQLEIQEQTMQTIGADLHDNIGQLLSLTSLTLNSIVLDNPGKAQQKIDTIIDLTKQSIKEMRLLGKLLQGDQIVVLGLSEAIRHQINWLERSGQFQIQYICEGIIPANRDPNKDLILFRILQEVLNNIIKHAQASQINIRLEYQASCIVLMIYDNGVGFKSEDLPTEQRGMGLLNMYKRASIVGGEVNLVSTPGDGTGVRIFIPY